MTTTCEKRIEKTGGRDTARPISRFAGFAYYDGFDGFNRRGIVSDDDETFGPATID